MLNFIGAATGINIAFSSDYRDPAGYTVQIDGVTLEEALQQILSANKLFYKVLNTAHDPDHSRQRAEPREVRGAGRPHFYLSHADATEVAQLLNTVMRVPGVAIIPTIAPNKTTQHDHDPRDGGNRRDHGARRRSERPAERGGGARRVDHGSEPRRAPSSSASTSPRTTIGGIFSPEVRRQADVDGHGGAPEDRGGGTLDIKSAFNANTFRRASAPRTSIWRCRRRSRGSWRATRARSSSPNRNCAARKGQKITLNLGDEIPVPQTTFGSLGGRAASDGAVSSFNYRTSASTSMMTPRVTFDGDIVLELTRREQHARQRHQHRRPEPALVRHAQGRDARSGCGTGSPRCSRDCCGRTSAGHQGRHRAHPRAGLPEPVLVERQRDRQTDIVMLLTPHIVRTHELRQQDVNPIYIGTQQNFGLGGPPPLIAPRPPPRVRQRLRPRASCRAAGNQPQRPYDVQPGPLPGTMSRRASSRAAAPAAAAARLRRRRRPRRLRQARRLRRRCRPEASAETRGAAVRAVRCAAGRRRLGCRGDRAEVVLTVPGTEFRIGNGPYTVPVSGLECAACLHVSLSITYGPAVVRVRSVQEGSFMRQGGVAASFTRQVDDAGRSGGHHRRARTGPGGGVRQSASWPRARRAGGRGVREPGRERRRHRPRRKPRVAQINPGNGDRAMTARLRLRAARATPSSSCSSWRRSSRSWRRRPCRSRA